MYSDHAPPPPPFNARFSHSHVFSLPEGFPRSDRGDACILTGGRVVRVLAFLTRPSWIALGEFKITVGCFHLIVNTSP